MKKALKIILSILVVPFGIVLGLIAGVIVGIPLFVVYVCDILLGQIWGYSR